MKLSRRDWIRQICRKASAPQGFIISKFKYPLFIVLSCAICSPPMSKYQAVAPRPIISGVPKAAAFKASPLLSILSYKSRKVHIPLLHKLREGNQFYFMKRQNYWSGRLMNNSNHSIAKESQWLIPNQTKALSCIAKLGFCTKGKGEGDVICACHKSATHPI